MLERIKLRLIRNCSDPFAAEQSFVDIDEPMNTEDKERVAIVKQI